MSIIDISKLALLIITAIAGIMSVLIDLSKADKDTTKQLKIVIDKSRSALFLWGAIGVCLFFLYGEMASPEPITKLFVFKIALYFSFLTFMAVTYLVKKMAILLTNQISDK